MKLDQRKWRARMRRRANQWAKHHGHEHRVPPRHIAAALGWKYVRDGRTGAVYHVPATA